MLILFMACLGPGSGDDSSGPDDSSPPAAVGPILAADSLDFDEVGLGCTGVEAFLFGNRGDEVLRLTKMSWSGDTSISFDFPTMPIDLEPGEKTEVSASFTPSRVGDATGTLLVDSTDARGEIGLGVLGTGVEELPCE